MSVEKRLVDCKRGRLRSGRARQRVVFVCRCSVCGREFVLSAYQRKLFEDGVRKSFSCGCVKIRV